MRVLYDYQAFEMQRFGGVSRYFFELIKHLDDTTDWELPIKYSANEYLSQLLLPYVHLEGTLNYYDSFLSNLNFKGKWSLYTLRNTLLPFFDKSQANQKYSKKVVSEAKFDIFHPTYYDDYFLRYLKKKPFVITIYDMIHERYPEYFVGHTTSERKKLLVDRAARVIAISENTKRDLIDIFGTSEEKIEVIYLANSLNNFSYNRQPKVTIDLPEKYLLYVGTRNIYKNFTFFLEAMQPLLMDYPELYVFCAGPVFSPREIHDIESLKMTHRVVRIEANDDTLFHLYSHALAFVFPSLYEGFGLPVLEAFHCGCPVILSNASSLPEVGGNAAVYFDPQDKISIRKQISLVLHNQQLRKQMIIDGYNQLQKFSWAQTAHLTQELYYKCI